MKNVFEGLLKRKTRVLVTHLLNIISNVDRVLLIVDGRVIQEGRYEKIEKTKEFKEFSMHVEQMVAMTQQNISMASHHPTYYQTLNTPDAELQDDLSERLETHEYGEGDAGILLSARDPVEGPIRYAPTKYQNLPSYDPVKAR